ncbi:23S rRNA (uracil(1939)-C(5))-methyltransferase RlmD [Niveibacterium sp. 24ML]|uniref:23S rRNA (uracil(1939)-C(5))-methyltransferase RlmD n=1 Tax=Niveibacterium sp. 24ML TaxID=2985512 RepID=UPI0022700FDD|nr:23S rRNA (uracil(1939)-C(5))-methyltransferase RlmD [Niveibacterium sp. 24ML]MCX9156065.1 23S rRNA (uracil(1939)-C(5))-methyltransferase RlmD [Niveibacterium sp. 24ML]
MPIAVVESLDYEGRGVARVEGKAIFIEGALIGEQVEFSSYRKKPKFEQATMVRLVKGSPLRVTPKCAHFGVCGGCSMQHLDDGAQLAVKQRVLEDNLWHLGRLRPARIYPAIQGATWGYRYRARIGVRQVASRGGVLVGFHEKKSSYIADMHACPVLPPEVGQNLMALRELVAGLSCPDRIPQIELAVDETRIVLVFRNLVPLTRGDVTRLLEFGREMGFGMWSQPGGPDTAHPLSRDDADELAYTLPEFGLRLAFRPTDFTQVNVGINRLLIRRSMQLLDPRPGERIADLFCGLGNFSLPIARCGAYVVGVEGSDALVARAESNARINGLSELSEFHAANLFEATPASLARLGQLDKMLIDPPREGAIAVVKALGDVAPRRIVYVSCNPSSLARDAAVLVHEKGYRLEGAGVANMFPHTSHVESVALFVRD